MSARIRLHAVSGSVVVSAERRDDVDAGPKARATSASDGSVEIKGERGSSKLKVAVPIGSDVCVGTASGDVQLVGELGEVTVTTVSGSIDVDHASSADLRSVSGDIVVASCGGLCRASNKSGKVVVTDTEAAELSSISGSVRVGAKRDVDVRTVSGKVGVKSAAEEPVRVRTVSGSIEVSLPPGVSRADATLDLKSVSGKIKIDPR